MLKSIALIVAASSITLPALADENKFRTVNCDQATINGAPAVVRTIAYDNPESPGHYMMASLDRTLHYVGANDTFTVTLINGVAVCDITTDDGWHLGDEKRKAPRIAGLLPYHDRWILYYKYSSIFNVLIFKAIIPYQHGFIFYIFHLFYFLLLHPEELVLHQKVLLQHQVLLW